MLLPRLGHAPLRHAAKCRKFLGTSSSYKEPLIGEGVLPNTSKGEHDAEYNYASLSLTDPVRVNSGMTNIIRAAVQRLIDEVDKWQAGQAPR